TRRAIRRRSSRYARGRRPDPLTGGHAGTPSRLSRPGPAGSVGGDVDRAAFGRRTQDGIGHDDGGEALLHGHYLAALAEYRVTQRFVLGAQRLRLGDGVGDDVALAHTAELGDIVPDGGHRTVGVEGQVGVQRVGDERAP